MSRDRGRDRGGGRCGRSVNTGRHGRGRRVMETQESRGGRCGIQVETGSRDGVSMWWPGMGGWYGWRCGCLAGLGVIETPVGGGGRCRGSRDM